MAMKTALAVAGTGALLTLQGCGGGSTTTAPATTAKPATTTTAPATNITSTTTTPTRDPQEPLPGEDVAALMNDEYTGFDKDNPNGTFGVYLRITGHTTVYCHEGCYSGYADCRISGSVYNPTQIVDASTGAIAWTFKGTGTTGDFLGLYVNQTLIKQRLGKCAYIGDGGTDDKYNMGCGKQAACSNSCDDITCAYAGMDPATNYQTPINGDSDVVAGAMMGGPGCYDVGLCGYKGPAFWKETGLVPDETFNVWKFRAEHPGGDWNEYVLDGEMLKESLADNPAATIPAIVYASTFPGGTDAGKAAAKEMAQALADEWNMTALVPVIKIDLSVNVVNGGRPFVFEDTESELVV